MNASKKILCIITAAATLAGLAGCDRKTTESASSSGSSRSSRSGARESKTPGASSGAAERGRPAPSKDAGAGDAEDEAIEFHNTLYGFVSAANKPLEKITTTIAEAVSSADRDYTSDTTLWGDLRRNQFGDGFSRIPNFKLEVPESFSSDDKEFFNKGIGAIRDSVREIISIAGELDKYYAAEDFKDDWYKKVYMAQPRLEKLIATIRDNSAPLRDRADDITEEIDARNVAKIPVGPWVSNMRGFMKKYRQMCDCLLRDEFTDESYGSGLTAEQRQARLVSAGQWADKAEAMLAELDDMAASQRTLTIAGYENSRYEGYYTSFYKQYDTSKIVMRKLLRDLREKGTVYDDYKIKDAQRDLSRYSGEFADLWNEKGSRGK